MSLSRKAQKENHYHQQNTNRSIFYSSSVNSIDNNSVVSMSSALNNNDDNNNNHHRHNSSGENTRTSQRRELESVVPEGEEERLILEQRQATLMRSSSASAPAQQQQKMKQQQEKSSFVQKYIKDPMLGVAEYFMSFSFIGLLLSYSGFMCFAFALVLLALQPPTITQKIYYHDNSSNNSAEMIKTTTGGRTLYPVKNPSSVLASLKKLHLQNSEDYILNVEEESAAIFAPKLKIVGANPSHHYSSSSHQEHFADQEDYSNILHLLPLVWPII